MPLVDVVEGDALAPPAGATRPGARLALLHQVSRALIGSGRGPQGLAAGVARELGVDLYRCDAAGVSAEGPVLSEVRSPRAAPEGARRPEFVIGAVGQVLPGGPRAAAGETRLSRLALFSRQLDAAPGLLDAAAPGETWDIVVPRGVGCGLAGGRWREYLTVLQDFAARLPPGWRLLIVHLRAGRRPRRRSAP